MNGPQKLSSVEDLVSEFNDELQTGTVPSYEPFVRRCPTADRTELVSLLNTLVLADRALAPLRELLQDAPAPERRPVVRRALGSAGVRGG